MNVGFKQYKLPNNVSLNQQITINDESYIDNNHPLQKAIDGHKTTYCQLNKVEGLNLKDAQIIITFDKTYLCNYLQIFFNNIVKKIKMYDYSEGSRGALLLSQTGQTQLVENIVDKELSAVLLTDFETIEANNDIQISEINVFNNTIEAPEGYYIRDIEIQSELKEEDV